MPSGIKVGCGEFAMTPSGEVVSVDDSPREGKREAKSEPITISKIENSGDGRRISIGTPRLSSDVVKRGE